MVSETSSDPLLKCRCAHHGQQDTAASWCEANFLFADALSQVFGLRAMLAVPYFEKALVSASIASAFQ